jgi:hypothetical protein
MPKLVLFICVVLVSPLTAWAQAPLKLDLPAAQATPQRAHQFSAGPPSMSGAALGAIVGGGAGVLTGFWYVASQCGGSGCSAKNYFESAAYFGGLGAAIGAVIGSQPHSRRHPARTRPSVLRLAPIVTPRVRGGVAAIRF